MRLPLLSFILMLAVLAQAIIGQYVDSTASATAACSSDADVSSQHKSLCHLYCPTLHRPPGVNVTRRQQFFCHWCSCHKCALAAQQELAPEVTTSDFDAAVATIADAVAGKMLPPLASIVTLMDAVSSNAETAYLRNRSQQEVLGFFGGYGSIGTEPLQMLAYAREFACAAKVPQVVCEVGLFQGHSAALFLALTAHQAATCARSLSHRAPIIRHATRVKPSTAAHACVLDAFDGRRPCRWQM